VTSVYQREIQMLDSTYRWAVDEPLQKLISFVDKCLSLPLITVGSGGSQTVALLGTLLHQEAGGLSLSSTPLELNSSGINLRKTCILMCSARGRNPDVISAFRTTVRAEPLQFGVLCAEIQTPLAHLAQEFHYVHLSEFRPPAKKDGFLATNSTLAMAVLLVRAYEISSSSRLPPTLSLLTNHSKEPNPIADVHDSIVPVLSKRTIVVLFDKWSKPAAFDMESRFTEAALANVQLADYRNFAHGRHYWLARRSSDAGVIALTTPDGRSLAERTLALLPKDIPATLLSTKETGALATLALIVKVMHLAGLAGTLKNFDIGRPGVPLFGRRLYNLWTAPEPRKNGLRLSTLEAIAISRKIGSSMNVTYRWPNVPSWTVALRSFVHKLSDARLRGIVFDYDGTLCELSERFKGPTEDIGLHLNTFLTRGLTLGIVTGRGRSVRDQLRKVIHRRLWGRVTIGYYNGSDVSTLEDTGHPDISGPPDRTIALLKSVLVKSDHLNTISKMTFRPQQITIEPEKIRLSELESTVNDFIRSRHFGPVQVVESAHSIDILAPNVSKLSVVRAIETMEKQDRQTTDLLCIGDSGRWPGNDFDLLTSPYSLSVNSVSSDPESCWNLAPPGHRNVQATIDYMKAFQIEDNSLTINISRITGMSP
jgi:hydroxymethylpyrimidine pyrophosphatase-like HAD family hydrolase